MKGLRCSSVKFAAIAVPAIVLAGFLGCESEPTPAEQPICRVNQFRRCDHECGRGVEQCVEPGVWSACACTVLDAGFVTDALVDRRANDAGEASDAGDGDGASDAPSEGDDGREPDAVGETGTADGPPD